MDDELQAAQAFWDDFAQEYEEIQQESVAPIEQTLTDFLLAEKILPAASFLDLAGGTGRYLPYLQPYTKDYLLVDFSAEMLRLAQAKNKLANTRFIRQEQQAFFSQTKPAQFELVFSAMNPALTPIDLAELIRISSNWILLLRMTKQVDSLFSPFEAVVDQTKLMKDYQTWLTKQKIPYQTKTFTFHSTQTITRDFFHDYFSDSLSPEQLSTAINQLFGDQHQSLNHQTIEFELLYFKK